MGYPLLSRLSATLLIGFILLLTVDLCYGHSHDHNHHDHDHDAHHHHENPSFKYSREANQPLDSEHLDHSHDHSSHNHHDEHDDHQHHPQHTEHTHDGSAKPQSQPQQQEPSSLRKRDSSEVWLSALGATLLISLAPFGILWFIPLDNSAEYQPLLKVLLSFASGGLLGDAFLHLIPHALMAQQSSQSAADNKPHSHGHGHSHGGHDGEHTHCDMSVGLWVLAGVLAFLVVEKFVRICKGPGHGHSHGPPKTGKESKPQSDSKKEKTDDKATKKQEPKQQGETDEEIKEIAEKKKPSKTALKGSPKTEQNRETENTSKCPDSPSGKRVRFTGVDKFVPLSSEPVEQIKVAGYLNLAADFAHNLTDGLAIGASFITSPAVGLITTMTILFHEIPHEIGDFAILVQSGCSRRKAMFLQLLTAVGALTGTLISLVAGGMSATASPWILPFTAGGFIYIACVSVIPELLEETSLKQSILEIIAAAIGVLIMVFIATFE